MSGGLIALAVIAGLGALSLVVMFVLVLRSMCK